jgi:hypothetical protein
VSPFVFQTSGDRQREFPCPDCSPDPGVVSSKDQGWGRNVKWDVYSQISGDPKKNEGSSEQVQYVTAIKPTVKIYQTDSFESMVMGTILECETLTLKVLNPYTGFYEVFFDPSTSSGQAPCSTCPPANGIGFVHEDDVVVGRHLSHMKRKRPQEKF